MNNIKFAEQTNPFFNLETLLNNSPNQPFTDLVAVPQNALERLPEFHDDVEKSLCVLEHYSFLPKVFCSATMKDDAFLVKSNRWNWQVEPLKESDCVPQIFLEGVLALLKNNIKIDSLAIAHPTPKEYVPEILMQEFIHGLKMLGKMFGFLILGVFAFIGGAGKSNAHNEATLVENPDPVLLAKIDNNWVEIGRWDKFRHSR